VPSDSVLASLPCPICQERFVPSWNDDVQDWVWMDAIQIGSKVYHASCYSELQKDGANTPRIATPDSVLGKRKAEVCLEVLAKDRIYANVLVGCE
jgi:pre-mRNA cleavage complex 2 protein Pcf11